MIYSTSLRQINYIASWIKNYIENADVNVLEEGLTKNEKYRDLSMFGKNLDKEKIKL